MRPMTKLAAATLLAATLAACTSSGGGGSGDTWGGGQFVRSNDTLGTQRRMDVYGGATSPVLPTIGASGYGK